MSRNPRSLVSEGEEAPIFFESMKTIMSCCHVCVHVRTHVHTCTFVQTHGVFMYVCMQKIKAEITRLSTSFLIYFV